MSRIEAGALKLRRQWNILVEVVDTVIDQMDSALSNHRLDVEVAEDLPLIPVDPVLIQQVFANLLSNCLKYAPEGTAILINAQTQGKEPEEILVQIANEGPPVPEEHLEHIFDKFHRVTAADQIPGTGLGLSICRGIVEAHGGNIWAENLPGGFAFWLTLPVTWKGAAPQRVPVEPEA
jgi:two-component system sensor histidine kinase KdpD